MHFSHHNFYSLPKKELEQKLGFLAYPILLSNLYVIGTRLCALSFNLYLLYLEKCKRGFQLG